MSVRLMFSIFAVMAMSCTSEFCQELPATKGKDAPSEHNLPATLGKATDELPATTRHDGAQQAEKPVRTHEGLQSTLWVQTSLEYRMACKQVFAFAELQLEKNLADKAFTAALEQRRRFSELPAAVILDVDETVLDNSPFQARVVDAGGSFDLVQWKKWVEEAKAKAVPGAADFIHFLQLQKVKVVFVTNRSADMEAKTIENLESVFGIKVDKEAIHCKYERPEWGSNKRSRRIHVCKTHRVIALMGDDFNDFAWVGKTPPQDRVAIGSQFESRWSDSWFLLPNPLYGNWDKAIYDYDYNTKRPGALKLKYDLLETGR